MGNFSRDPQERLNDSIAKHYVGVRMQQGVPLVDADWNEMEDLRRHEVETLGGEFIGDGVPSGSDGFRIMALEENNNFSIKKGNILVNGKKVRNDNDITFLTQSNSDLVDVLTTPNEDTSYVIYLDTWEQQVDSQSDPDLVDNRIGIETSLRLKREWIASVVEGEDLGDLPNEPEGHNFYPLALLNRHANEDRITFEMITDLRRLHLTLADNAKAPLEIYGPLGTVRFDLQNFAELLDLTEQAYFNLLNSDLFMTDNFASATPLEATMLSVVFNEVMQSARAASIQAKIRNLNNDDGIEVLETLYHAEDHFVTVVGGFVAGDAARIKTSRLLDDLREFLDGGPGGIPPGLQEAVITNENLEAGIEAQQEINREIGNRTQILPHGHLVVILVGGPPTDSLITAGDVYRYDFEISYQPTTPGPPQQETFDIRLAMNPPGWTPTLVGNSDGEITLLTGESVVVQVDIEIPLDTTLTGATLEFNVRSQRNPAAMDVTNDEVELVIGSSGTQPIPFNIDLTSPAINIAEDILAVGRGGPVGLPGRGVNLKFRFSYFENVATPEVFTVSFASTPPGAFEDIVDLPLELGGTAGQDEEHLFGFQATTGAVNGTTGTLTVHMERDSDPTVFKDLVINLQVQKS